MASLAAAVKRQAEEAKSTLSAAVKALSPATRLPSVPPTSRRDSFRLASAGISLAGEFHKRLTSVPPTLNRKARVPSAGETFAARDQLLAKGGGRHKTSQLKLLGTSAGEGVVTRQQLVEFLQHYNPSKLANGEL
jgi:hypothetical protein